MDPDTIRYADRKGQETESLKAFKDALDKAPVVDGTIYRGFTVRTEEEMTQFKEGGTFKLNALSSFSEDSKIATEFAVMSASSNDKPFIIMELRNSGTARSIKDFGRGEKFEASSNRDKEAIGFKGTRYKIASIEKTTAKSTTFSVRGEFKTFKGIKVVVEEIK
jgi:hypothetical protein